MGRVSVGTCTFLFPVPDVSRLQLENSSQEWPQYKICRYLECEKRTQKEKYLDLKSSNKAGISVADKIQKIKGRCFPGESLIYSVYFKHIVEKLFPWTVSKGSLLRSVKHFPFLCSTADNKLFFLCLYLSSSQSGASGGQGRCLQP